jgi:alpha-L-fucosidase
VRNLIDIASKGGNYLLNVGPTAEGVIPQPSVERLRAVGEWMKANGAAIYGTTASPFANQLSFGRATRKAGRVYLHVFDWPTNGSLQVPSWGAKVSKAYLLTDPKRRLKFDQQSNSVTIQLPESAPDRIATVIVLDTAP